MITSTSKCQKRRKQAINSYISKVMENCIKERSERLILIKGKVGGINMKLKIRTSIVLIIISPISKFCVVVIFTLESGTQHLLIMVS
jgi:hypothetical protein